MGELVEGDFTGATILLVDDNPANLNVLIDYMLTEAYQIMVAESGESALQRLQFRLPDVILLDVAMPGIDGYETCRRIKARADSAEIPVIFLSAQNEVVDRLEGFAAGGVDYIAKPLNVTEVNARVRTHLRLRALQESLAERNQRLQEQAAQHAAELSDAQRVAEQRKQENGRLMGLIQEQSDQLHRVINILMHDTPDGQQFRNQGIAQHAADKLAHVQQELHSAQMALAQANSASKVQTSLNRADHIVKQLQQLFSTEAQLKTSEAPAEASNDPLEPLSKREREIFHHVVNGLSNKQIAKAAHIAETTVRTYKLRMMRKLDVDSLSALVRLGLNLSSKKSQ